MTLLINCPGLVFRVSLLVQCKTTHYNVQRQAEVLLSKNDMKSFDHPGALAVKMPRLKISNAATVIPYRTRASDKRLKRRRTRFKASLFVVKP